MENMLYGFRAPVITAVQLTDFHEALLIVGGVSERRVMPTL